VRSFAAERVESERYSTKVDESFALGVKKAVAYGAFTGGVGALAYCAMLLVSSSNVVVTLKAVEDTVLLYYH